jgi:hypothetical protein
LQEEKSSLILQECETEAAFAEFDVKSSLLLQECEITSAFAGSEIESDFAGM